MGKVNDAAIDFPIAFHDDPTVPIQFAAAVKSRAYRLPEQRLMAAVLEDVVKCLSVDLRRVRRRRHREYIEAHSWVNERTENDWVFSFESVSETLGFDADYLRRGLNEWAERHRSGKSVDKLKARRMVIPWRPSRATATPLK